MTIIKLRYEECFAIINDLGSDQRFDAVPFATALETILRDMREKGFEAPRLGFFARTRLLRGRKIPIALDGKDLKALPKDGLWPILAVRCYLQAGTAERRRILNEARVEAQTELK